MSYHDHRGHCSGLSVNKIKLTVANSNVLIIELEKLFGSLTIEEMVRHDLIEFRSTSEKPFSDKDLFYRNFIEARIIGNYSEDVVYEEVDINDITYVFPTNKMISIIEEAERRAFGTTASVPSGWK